MRPVQLIHLLHSTRKIGPLNFGFKCIRDSLQQLRVSILPLRRRTNFFLHAMPPADSRFERPGFSVPPRPFWPLCFSQSRTSSLDLFKMRRARIDLLQAFQR
mgnify:CR=1 FL=1